MSATTILSDNGVTSGSAGVKTSGGTDGTLQLQTTTAGGTATTALSIDNSQVITFTNQPTYTGGTANGVAYLNGSKVLTTGSALVFDGANLGLGVTPSAWDSVMKAIQIGSGGSIFNWTGSSGSVSIGANLYDSGSSIQRYINTAAASSFDVNNGSFAWRIAPSGTAGDAISFTQAMTLDASGILGVGPTNPSSYSGRFAVVGGASSNYFTAYFGDGSSKFINFVTNATGGAYNAITGSGDNLLYSGAQYQPMTVGVHDGGAIRFTNGSTSIGAGSSGIVTTFSNSGYQTTNGYVEAKNNDVGTVFSTVNTSAAQQQYYVSHFYSAINIGNARGDIYHDAGPSATSKHYMRAVNTGIFWNTTATRAALQCERFFITSNTGGTTVTLSSSDRFTGIIAVYGSGNDTSAYVFYVAGASSYDLESIGTLVSNGSSAGYTGSTTIALNTGYGTNLTMTVTSSASTTRTYEVFYFGAIN